MLLIFFEVRSLRGTGRKQEEFPHVLVLWSSPNKTHLSEGVSNPSQYTPQYWMLNTGDSNVVQNGQMQL